MRQYLPGISSAYVKERLSKAGGKEIESGKFDSPASSAALAVNCFAWFHERPELLPPFPGTSATCPAMTVDVEFEARFPWNGGRHPWLDAFIVTASHVIGVESKRYEPFRDKKKVDLSKAYDRPVWGERMSPYEHMRDRLRSGELRYRHLDATQLVKHAFGLVTQASRDNRRAILIYLFAEPAELNGRVIAESDIQNHRAEVIDFGSRVCGGAVEFLGLSYREWIASWDLDQAVLADHAQSILERFRP